MKRSKLVFGAVMLAVAVAASLMAVGTASAFRPGRQKPGTLHVSVAVQGTSFYAGLGSLEFVGNADFDVIANPGDDPQSRVHTNLVQVVGTNALTGESCRAVGTQDFNVASGSVLVFRGVYSFTPTDPCGGLGGVEITYRVTFDEQGNVVEASALASNPQGGGVG